MTQPEETCNGLLADRRSGRPNRARAGGPPGPRPGTQGGEPPAENQIEARANAERA